MRLLPRDRSGRIVKGRTCRLKAGSEVCGEQAVGWLRVDVRPSLSPGTVLGEDVDPYMEVPACERHMRLLAADFDGVADEPLEKLCPDGGTCHHACGEMCWRVKSCGPLSGVYPGDEWPDAVKRAHGGG